MTVLNPVGDPADLAEIYSRILEPSFAPAELVELSGLLAAIAAGETEVLVPEDRARAAQAVAVGDLGRQAALLSYLAVAPESRANGLGGRLLDAAVARWSGPGAARIVLAEIERPDRFEADPLRGDPARRLAFYRNHGARLIDVPYFQPALRPETGRVRGMLLLALSVHADDVAEGRLRETGPLRELLEAYFAATEGAPRADDAAARALFAALENPRGVRLLDPADYAANAFSS